MVTVIDYAVRQNSEGEPFVALMLQGDLEMVQSQETGRFYATARKCSIPSTFSEQVAQQMIGQQISGQIIKEDCEPYDYVIPETGETIELSHTWEYTPEEKGERAPSVQPASLNRVSPDQLNDEAQERERPVRASQRPDQSVNQRKEHDEHIAEAAF